MVRISKAVVLVPLTSLMLNRGHGQQRASCPWSGQGGCRAGLRHVPAGGSGGLALVRSELTVSLTSSTCPLDALEPEATAASPRKKKKRKRKQESQQEVAEKEHAEGWQGDRQRGSASPSSGPSPTGNGQCPGDHAGVPLGGGHAVREGAGGTCAASPPAT